jgi:hypothetical protein
LSFSVYRNHPDARSLDFGYINLFTEVPQPPKLDEASSPPMGCQTHGGSSSYNTIIGASMTRNMYTGGRLKRLFLGHNLFCTGLAKRDQSGEFGVIFTDQTETRVTARDEIPLNVMDG